MGISDERRAELTEKLKKVADLEIRLQSDDPEVRAKAMIEKMEGPDGIVMIIVFTVGAIAIMFLLRGMFMLWSI